MAALEGSCVEDEDEENLKEVLVKDGKLVGVADGLELSRLLGVNSANELVRRVGIEVVAKCDDVDGEDIDASNVKDEDFVDASTGTIVRSSP